MGMMIIVEIFCGPGYLIWHLIWFISGKNVDVAGNLTRAVDAGICVFCAASAVWMVYGYFIAKTIEDYNTVMLMAAIGLYIMLNLYVLNNHLSNHMNGETY